MAINGRVYMSLAMLVIFLAMVGIASSYPPEARLLPFVIGIPGVVLCLVQVILEMLAVKRAGGGETRPPGDEEAEARPRGGAAIRRELSLLAYLVALVLAVLLFGFWLAIPVLVIVFLRGYEGESWRLTLGLTAGAWGILYLIFDRVLKIFLFKGFLIEAFFG